MYKEYVYVCNFAEYTTYFSNLIVISTEWLRLSKYDSGEIWESRYRDDGYINVNLMNYDSYKWHPVLGSLQ